MVKATAAVAFAVLAMSASTLARPVDFSDEVIAREFDDYEMEARDYGYELDVDAREEDYDFYSRELELAEEEARDYEYDLDAREDDYDFESRDYQDFEDFDARDEYDWEDVVERQTATTTSAPSSTITPAPTESTSTVTNTRNGKPTKTIITHAKPTSCQKPGLGARIRRAFRNMRNRNRERRNKKNKSSSSASSTSASSTITSAPTTTATATSTGRPKTVDSTTKGPDGTRTINRTIIAAKTPCPEVTKRAVEYGMDELD